jgi:hypothetical protein
VEEAKQHYANGNPLGAIGSLKAAVLSIWEQAPLTVQNVRLVKDTKSYALRENNLYRSGEPVYISCEIVGHRLNRVGQTYQIHITTDFEVLDPGGKILGGQKDVFKFKNVSPIPNTEFYLNLTYRLTGAPKGAYDILTTVHDRQSGKQAKFKTRIRLQ